MERASVIAFFIRIRVWKAWRFIQKRKDYFGAKYEKLERTARSSFPLSPILFFAFMVSGPCYVAT